MLIDTHCHLDDSQLRDDWPKVLAQARAAGVEAIIAVATDLASSRFLTDRLVPTGHLDLPVRVYPTAGIHPNHVAREPAEAWEGVESILRAGKAVAVGETGLDLHWHDTPFEQQKENFSRHLLLARELDLPVIIHCRDCVPEMVEFLTRFWKEVGPVRGVMHSFSGDEPFARTCLDLGLKLSFSGVLTYKNAEALREVARVVPRDSVMVETDAPYLAPVPKRGKRNEPAFVSFTAMELARIWGVSPLEAMKLTGKNALELFRLKLAP